ncbi:hypothetical protein [Kitasatospora sp. NPDC085464]|uniref:hypothetical protein n=1 Tax=Kitasatospora sp. NPDC085464 TaxID=3364063 RepID=UPI0037CBE8FD
MAGRRTGEAGPSGLAPEARVPAVVVTDDAGATTPDLLGDGIRAAVGPGAPPADGPGRGAAGPVPRPGEVSSGKVPPR